MAAFRFRKKTDYGLSMLTMLAKSNTQYVSVSKMRKNGLPRSFLVKIAQELIGAGIIGSKEGRGGGYYLKVDPEKYTLDKVIKVLEGDIGVVDCVIHRGACPMEEKCSQKNTLKKLSKDLEKVLARYTLSDLC